MFYLGCIGTRKITEIKDQAESYRAMERTRRAFMKVTKCVSWEEATKKYPDHKELDRSCQTIK